MFDARIWFYARIGIVRIVYLVHQLCSADNVIRWTAVYLLCENSLCYRRSGVTVDIVTSIQHYNGHKAEWEYLCFGASL